MLTPISKHHTTQQHPAFLRLLSIGLLYAQTKTKSFGMLWHNDMKVPFDVGLHRCTRVVLSSKATRYKNNFFCFADSHILSECGTRAQERWQSRGLGNFTRCVYFYWQFWWATINRNKCWKTDCLICTFLIHEGIKCAIDVYRLNSKSAANVLVPI